MDKTNDWDLVNEAAFKANNRMVFSATTDKEIEQMWDELSGARRVAAVEVSLTLPLF